jgi:[CysO sulfur-carrier protein]-S-L-cysteine hydrolase
MIRKIVLTMQQLKDLVSLAKDSLPNESCALLLGNNIVDDEAYVLYLIPVKNSNASVVSFSIDPQELFDAYQTAQNLSLEVVGIFHSHPSQPLPSSTDKRFMEINPVVWLIYSTLTNESKAYIFEEKIKKVEIHVVTA